jgi:hypothetical protein
VLIVALVCVGIVVLSLLTASLDPAALAKRWFGKEQAPDQEIDFYPVNEDEDILVREDYLGLDRYVYYTDPMTGEETIQVVNVPQTALEQLQATVKIDVTPKGVYDRFAQEQTIENLLLNGLLSAQRVGELKVYGELLPDDAVAPKMLILEGVERIQEEQRRIAMIDAQAQMMRQRANQFLMGDPDEQSSMMSEAAMQMQGGMPM